MEFLVSETRQNVIYIFVILLYIKRKSIKNFTATVFLRTKRRRLHAPDGQILTPNGQKGADHEQKSRDEQKFR